MRLRFCEPRNANAGADVRWHYQYGFGIRMASMVVLLVVVGGAWCWLPEDDYSGAADDNKGLLDFFFADYSTDWHCRCGAPNREARILGGEYLKTHEFPWLALIQVRGQSAVPGTLINDRYVLTSGSQMIGLTPYDVKVTLGQFDRCFPDVTSQNVSVAAILLHPDFSPVNRAQDVALVRLNVPLQYQRRARPICLSLPGHTYTGQVATVVGWADAPETDDAASATSPTCRPRKVGLPVLSHADCAATAFNPAYASSDKGCAGIIGTRSVICSADAGSPVMYRSRGGSYEIIGLLSDQNDCSDAPSTALYTKVSTHLEWIKRNTRDAVYCVKSDY